MLAVTNEFLKTDEPFNLIFSLDIDILESHYRYIKIIVIFTIYWRSLKIIQKSFRRSKITKSEQIK